MTEESKGPVLDVTRVLAECAATFRDYERHHRDKASEAGRSAKAERNAAMAEKVEAVLYTGPIAMSEGAFRMGARAMREVAAQALYKLWDGEPEDGEELRMCVRDTPLPDFPAQPEPQKQVWAWWSGGDGEWFTNGPCATREEAIGELCGEGGHLVEALAGVVHFSAERLIADQYFEDDQGFDYDHSEPDRVGGADVIAAADAELQALLDGWLARWGHTFVKPSLFAATRNAEYVEPDAAEASA